MGKHWVRGELGESPGRRGSGWLAGGEHGVRVVRGVCKCVPGPGVVRRLVGGLLRGLPQVCVRWVVGGR